MSGKMGERQEEEKNGANTQELYAKFEGSIKTASGDVMGNWKNEFEAPGRSLVWRQTFRAVHTEMALSHSLDVMS